MKKFIGNQPITISSTNYDKNIMYYLTYKLDGKRHLYQNGFLITSKLEKFKFDLGLNFPVTLDGELYQGKFYVFDILFYKGKDVRKLTMTERLKILKEIKRTNKSLILKEYWSPYSSSIKKNFYEIKKLYKKDLVLNGKVDGIIFTPDLEYYATVLKWKPVELLSIDFKIHKINDKFEMLLQNGSIYHTIIPKKVDYNRYPDNTVVEFIWKKSKGWLPIRERPDKINSNWITVIESNWAQIQNPVNMNKLLSR
jgi:hypothetical protein